MRPFHRLLFCFTVVLTASFSPLYRCNASTLEENVREHSLKNGLRLLVLERHDSPTFAAYITLGVGSVHEDSRTRGVAHLLEHMLFKGTRILGTTDYEAEKPLLEQIERTSESLDALRNKKGADPQRIKALESELAELYNRHKNFVVKDEFSKIYSENGGVGYNAFTSKDLTSYLISLPSNKLELWAAIEADRMKNAVLREFYTERDVVMEERRRSYDSDPAGKLYETLLANAFTVHPYRNPIIGWPSDISNLSLEETRAFLKAYYAPVNTTIALVGDVKFDDAVAMVERYFGDIAPGVSVPEVLDVEPQQKAEKRVEVYFDAEPQVAVAFHKPTLPEKDDYVFDLIEQVLAEGRASRLFRSLVIEKQLAASVSTYGAPGSRYPNLFVISATPRHPHSPEDVEAAIYQELEKLSSEPVSTEELERARNRLRTDRLRYLRDNNGLARMLTYYQTVAGDWRYLTGYDEVVAGIGAEEIRQAASRYFRPSNRTVVTLRKGSEEP